MNKTANLIFLKKQYEQKNTKKIFVKKIYDIIQLMKNHNFFCKS